MVGPLGGSISTLMVLPLDCLLLYRHEVLKAGVIWLDLKVEHYSSVNKVKDTMKKISFSLLLASIISLLGSNFSYAANPSVVVFLPIKSATPGVTNPDVTQSNIEKTICSPNFVKKLKPATSFTEALKTKQLKGSYKRYLNTKSKDFTEDHLIPIELGGSPKSVTNLWPQPVGGNSGAELKDKLEVKLNSLVCSGAITLAEAQKAIATDWYGANIKYSNYKL